MEVMTVIGNSNKEKIVIRTTFFEVLQDILVLLALEQDIILMGRDILYHFDTLSAHQLHKCKSAFRGGL